VIFPDIASQYQRSCNKITGKKKTWLNTTENCIPLLHAQSVGGFVPLTQSPANDINMLRDIPEDQRHDA
jgi:hypothetical protein